MDQPKGKIVITDFAGLVSNRGRFPTSHPAEALVQTNLRCIRPGQLESRLGFRTITTDAAFGNGSTDIIAVYFLDGATPKLVIEDSDGKMWYGDNPT
jgi:hypothetical protein